MQDMMFQGKAHFVYEIDLGRREQSYTLQYYARDRALGIKLFLKWIDNRMEALPEIFDELGVVSICDYEPDSISEDGILQQGIRREFFTWKEGHIRHDPMGITPVDWKPVRSCIDPVLGIR